MMVRIPIEDAVELLEMEGYQIDSFPEGVIIEVPETFTPDDLYEIITEVLAMDEEQSSTLPIQIDRFDKGGIDITMEMRHIAPFLILTGTTHFGIQNGKLTINSVDTERIMMMSIEEDIELPQNIIPDKDVKYNIDFEDDYKIAKKLLHSNTPIRIVGNFEDDGGIIDVYIGNEHYNGRAEYGNQPKLPQINLPTYSEINPKDMANALNGILKISENVKVIARENDFEVLSKNELLSVMRFKFKGAVKEKKEINYITVSAVSTYTAIYLYKMADIVKKSKHPLEIHLGTDYPTDIRFTHEGVRYIYLLAPRVEAY